MRCLFSQSSCQPGDEIDSSLAQLFGILGSATLALKSGIKLPLILTRKGKGSCKTTVLCPVLLCPCPGVYLCDVLVTYSMIRLVGDVLIQGFSLASMASVSFAVGTRHSFCEVGALQKYPRHNSKQDGHFPAAAEL